MESTNAKKLTKNGNSLSLVIEKPLLDILGITSETFIKRTVQNLNGKQVLVIEAVDPTERKKLVREAAKRVMKTQEPVLRKLAK